MAKPQFDVVWTRIAEHSGQPFLTKTGLGFTYRVDASAFFPSRTKYRISRNDFRTAFDEAPYSGPGVLNEQVRGPTYVWAVLHDKRIRRNDW